MAKNLTGTVDMTVGTPWKKILQFTLPMLIGNIAQQFYSTVDTIVVGRYATHGDNAIAAVGSSLPILNMLLVLFIGISAGASVMVAQYFGAKNLLKTKETFRFSILCAFAIMVPFALVGLNFPETIVRHWQGHYSECPSPAFHTSTHSAHGPCWLTVPTTRWCFASCPQQAHLRG